MINVTIDETKPAGRRILNEIANNPKIGQIENSNIVRDENGVPKGHPWAEVRKEMNKKLSEHYSVDFMDL